jgi:hypothetical protein
MNRHLAMIGGNGPPQGANRMLSVKAGHPNKLVKDLLLVGTRGRMVAPCHRLDQFSSGCQTWFPSDSVARHPLRVTFS